MHVCAKEGIRISLKKVQFCNVPLDILRKSLVKLEMERICE